MRQRTAPSSSSNSSSSTKLSEEKGEFKFRRNAKVSQNSNAVAIKVTLMVVLPLVFIAVVLIILAGRDTLPTNPVLSRLRGESYLLQPKLTVLPSRHRTPIPVANKRTFWVEQKKINEPITRAFRDRKWTKVNDNKEAQLIWTYSADSEIWEEPYHPWQRTNHLPGSWFWNRKDGFVKGFKEYEMRVPGKDHYFNPETYLLAESDEREKFRKKLTREGGMNRPWVLKEGNVNQGRGITMLAPHSAELENLLDNHSIDDAEETNLVVQSYICNELTWNRRKYDVRMFWLVASIDPLLVLYHDGYVRIGNAVYDESDFSNTRNHLTTHTRLAEEGKATFEEFKQHLRQHNRDAQLGISDPVAHVRNQFKEAIGETIAAFKDKSFTTKEMVEENGIGFFGADFILDQSLDVYFLEPQTGCGLDEDYNFRIEMHDQLFRSMVDILDEVLLKEESGESLLPLKKPGKWQVVYADGWVYKFDGYERSKNKKGCNLPKEHGKKDEFKEMDEDTK
jgi:Tubulin-tyrosine ligase family